MSNKEKKEHEAKDGLMNAILKELTEKEQDALDQLLTSEDKSIGISIVVKMPEDDEKDAIEVRGIFDSFEYNEHFNVQTAKFEMCYTDKGPLNEVFADTPSMCPCFIVINDTVSAKKIEKSILDTLNKFPVLKQAILKVELSIYPNKTEAINWMHFDPNFLANLTDDSSDE